MILSKFTGNINLELNVILPIGRMVPQSDAAKYCTVVVLVPLALVFTTVDYGLFKVFTPAEFKWQLSYTCNLVCGVFNVVFISQVCMSVLPFQCSNTM